MQRLHYCIIKRQIETLFSPFVYIQVMKMMRVSVFSMIASFVVSNCAASLDVFHPTRFSFDSLLKDDSGFDPIAFKTAMAQVGMISVTGLFASTQESDQNKKATFAYLHECAMDANFSEIHTFQDGTIRRTLPTRSIPNGIQPFPDMNENGSVACQKFIKASFNFREKVAEATTAFSNRLLTVLDSQRSYPLLKTEYGYAFDTVADVVENGEHLEHFHSYQKSMTQTENDDATVEWHTDQGLFIAFTPGRKVHCHNKGDATVTGGFSILQEDGTEAQVQFDDKDDLIFMLGDGVNQYVNSKKEATVQLRAVPHTLSMPDHEADEARVWYGRMVLPPSDAVHPDHDVTFGDLRQRVNDGVHGERSDNDALSLACSGSSMVRSLSEETCTNNTIMCWHRCMDASAFLPNVCESKGMVMNCTNPRGQLHDNTHGDFFPGCLMADAEIATPLPRLPNYPQNTFCSDGDFISFAGASTYDFMYELPVGEDGGSKAMFMWSKVDNNIQGRIAMDNIFGYISFGFAGIDGAKNGMHGGEVIMAFPGGNYSAVTGLDLSMPDMIDEYKIPEDKSKSSFRHWSTPITATSRSLGGTTSVNYTDCFTRMDFTLSGIGSKSFNLSGTDDLMWAANAVDYFAGYHLGDRARFIINWSNGTGTHVKKAEVPAPGPAPAPASAPAPTASAPASSTSGSVVNTAVANWWLATILFVAYTL